MFLKSLILFCLIVKFSVVNSVEVICYIDTSSNAGYQLISTLKPNICTILNLAFSKVDTNGNVLASQVPNLQAFLQYKGTLIAPKIMLSLGGAADWQSLQNFVKISKTATLRQKFADSCLSVCQQYGLNGIDLDWEFPYASDRVYFVEVLKTLKATLSPHGYLLTIAVGASNWWAVGSGGLDIPNVGANVDLINLMTYDFHANAEWDRSFGLYFNAPLNDSPGRDSLMNALQLFKSVPSHKLIVGIPLYGNAYRTISSTSPGGKYSTAWPSMGVTPSYRDVCRLPYTRVAAKGPQWTPYMYGNGHWISYDDTVSVAKKSELVKKYQLGGVLVWSLEKDDDKSICDSCPFPLMRSINNAVGRSINCTFGGNGLITSGPIDPTTTSKTTTRQSTSRTTPVPGGIEGGISICPKVGLFPFPGDCSKFYQCSFVNKPPYIQTCALNRFFNHKRKYCDVKCVV